MASTKVNQHTFKTYNPEHFHSFKWIIEKFSKIKYNVVLKSPKFRTPDNTTWNVTLEKITSNPDKIVLCFYNSEIDHISLEIKVTLYDKNCEELLCPKVVLYKKEDTSSFSFPCEEINAISGYSTKLNPSEDIVVLLCEMKFQKSVLFTDTVNSFLSEIPLSSGLSTLSANLKKIFEESVGTDITFKIKGSIIPAHKSILIAGSNVFQKMLLTNMKEHVTSVIEIEDIEPHIFKLLLEYMYTGIAPDTDFETAKALIYAADKYSVLELKKIIFGLQLSKITPDNAVSLLSLADFFDDSDAKKTASSFIKHYLDDIPNIDSVLKILDGALSDTHGAELLKNLFSHNREKEKS